MDLWLFVGYFRLVNSVVLVECGCVFILVCCFSCIYLQLVCGCWFCLNGLLF